MTIARVRLGAALIAILAPFLTAFGATGAAFSGTTDNSSNQFAAGTVSLTDNDSGSALFNVSNMAPADSVTACIEVTHTGSLNAEVRLYGATTGGDGLEVF